MPPAGAGLDGQLPGGDLAAGFDRLTDANREAVAGLQSIHEHSGGFGPLAMLTRSLQLGLPFWAKLQLLFLKGSPAFSVVSFDSLRSPFGALSRFARWWLNKMLGGG